MFIDVQISQVNHEENHIDPSSRSRWDHTLDKAEQRDRLIERQAQQATTDRLTDQIGELKALLTLQARPAA